MLEAVVKFQFHNHQLYNMKILEPNIFRSNKIQKRLKATLQIKKCNMIY